jgi:hypothetical protein
MADNDDNPKDQRKAKREIRSIREMYKNADQLHAGFSETDAPRLQKPVSPEDPFGSLESDPTEAAESRSADAEHLWIVYVLADLAEYAQKKGLTAVYECIEDTQLRVTDILDPEESQDD